MMFGNIINIRKLVAIDLVLNGWNFITIESFLSVFFPMALGILFFGTFLGLYFILLSLNYTTILVYNLLIGSQSNAKKEVRYELSKPNRAKTIRKYNFQQLIGFIPLTFIILSLLQEIKKS